MQKNFPYGFPSRIGRIQDIILSITISGYINIKIVRGDALYQVNGSLEFLIKYCWQNRISVRGIRNCVVLPRINLSELYKFMPQLEKSSNQRLISNNDELHSKFQIITDSESFNIFCCCHSEREGRMWNVMM